MRLPLRGGRGRLLLAALLSACTYGCAIALMGCSAWLLSRAAERPAASALALMAVAVRALGLGRGLARYGERLVGHDATLRVVADLRVAIFSSLTRRRGAAHSGDVLSSVVTDVDAVQDLWLRCFIPFAAAALVSGASVAACLWWSTGAGLVLLLGLATSLVAVPTVAAVLSREELAVAEQRAGYQLQVLDVLHGSADLLVLGALPQALASAERAAEALAAVDRRASLRAGLLSALTSLLQAGTVLGVAAVALPAVQDGRLPRVGLAVLVLIALAAFEPIAPLVDAGALLPRSWGAVRRLTALLDVPAPPVGLDAGPGSTLRLRRVSAGYDRDPVLHDVDLDLHTGQCLAVVGPSGAGKSTLLRVLTGALVPDHGCAHLGSVEISSLDEAQLSRHVVLAEQEAYLFDASIRDNLRIADPDANDGQLLAALEVVGLDGWLHEQPQGWATRVGERGSKVSGGERKRLSVARALLSPAPVLLLDEPTEGLDADAADALLSRLIQANRHRALLVVTHRLAALELVDEVLALDRGRFCEAGLSARCSRTLVPGPRRNVETA